MFPVQQSAFGDANASRKGPLREPCACPDGGDVDSRHLDLMLLHAEILSPDVSIGSSLYAEEL